MVVVAAADRLTRFDPLVLVIPRDRFLVTIAIAGAGGIALALEQEEEEGEEEEEEEEETRERGSSCEELGGGGVG